MFQFGILLYEMLAGTPPFEESSGDEPDTLLERMQRGMYDITAQAGRFAARTPRASDQGVLAGEDPPRGFPRRPTSGATARAPARQHLAGRLPSSHRRLPVEPAGCSRASDSHSGTQPLARFHDAAWKLRVARWAVPAVTTALATVFVLAGYGFGIVSRETPDVPTELGAGPALVCGGRARAAATAGRRSHCQRPTTRSEIGTGERWRCANAPRPGQRACGGSRARAGTSAVRRAAVGRGPARGRSLRDHPERRLHRRASPGSHRITFEHPKLGRHETVVELVSG